MKQWKIPLPNRLPPRGNVHFAMAAKTNSGSRAELHAEFSEAKSRLMWKLAHMSDEQIATIIELESVNEPPKIAE